jgi:hypothetical protein
MRQFKFFYGYREKSLTEHWLELLNEYPPSITELGNIPITYPTWTGTTYTPTWVVNPGLITYTPPNYTITTTPGTGTFTIPYNGTINTATGFSLTTSNTNGTTYTTGGMGGTLTTGTATFNSGTFTSNFK